MLVTSIDVIAQNDHPFEILGFKSKSNSSSPQSIARIGPVLNRTEMCTCAGHVAWDRLMNSASLLLVMGLEIPIVYLGQARPEFVVFHDMSIWVDPKPVCACIHDGTG